MKLLIVLSLLLLINTHPTQPYQVNECREFTESITPYMPAGNSSVIQNSNSALPLTFIQRTIERSAIYSTLLAMLLIWYGMYDAEIR